MALTNRPVRDVVPHRVPTAATSFNSYLDQDSELQ
jgi:hypothetical protein